MPPKNNFIEAIIRKFESQSRVFLICNAQLPLPRIIYSSDRFSEMCGYSRPQVMRNNCSLGFLHGPKTEIPRIREIEIGVAKQEETQIQVHLNRKDGTEFLCNVILVPVRSDQGQVIIYILIFDDLSPKSEKQALHVNNKKLSSDTTGSLSDN